MILLWGLEDDGPLKGVRKELERSGTPFYFLDHAEVLDCQVSVEFLPTLNGRLETPRGVLALGDVRSAYLRPYNFRQFPDLAECGEQSTEWRHAALFEDILWSWAELAPSLVLNRPAAMASNNSKPNQARLIAECGFQIPETLLTTSVSDATAFLAARREVIYKSISGTRSIVKRLAADRPLDDVRWCPTQFQAFVPGADYRVHVIGDDIFACTIESDADDYRYAASPMRPCDLPESVARRCRRLSQSLRLPLCGIDLRRTPGGEWFCFEVNPSPAYSCFPEDEAMSRSIAQLLAA